MYTLVLLSALTPGADPTPAVVAPAPVAGCVGCFGCAGCVGCSGCAGWSCAGCYGCGGSCHGGLFHGRGLFRHHHKASCYGCTGYSCDGLCFGCAGACWGCNGCVGCWGSPGVVYPNGTPGAGGPGAGSPGAPAGSTWWGAASPGAGPRSDWAAIPYPGWWGGTTYPGAVPGSFAPPGSALPGMVPGISYRVGPRFPVLPSPVPVFAMGSRSPYYESGGFWGTPDRAGNYISGVWQGTPYPGHLGGYGGYIGGGSAYAPPPGPSYTLYGQPNPPPIYGAPHTIYYPVATMPPPVGPEPDVPEVQKPYKEPKKEPEKEPGKGMNANLKFVVPAATTLYVDGRLTTVGGTERAFTTPPLTPGQKFYYDVKAELVIGGKPVVQEKRVIVEAGADITESFEKLTAAANATAGVLAGK